MDSCSDGYLNLFSLTLSVFSAKAGGRLRVAGFLTTLLWLELDLKLLTVMVSLNCFLKFASFSFNWALRFCSLLLGNGLMLSHAGFSTDLLSLGLTVDLDDRVVSASNSTLLVAFDFWSARVLTVFLMFLVILRWSFSLLAVRGVLLDRIFRSVCRVA